MDKNGECKDDSGEGSHEYITNMMLESQRSNQKRKRNDEDEEKEKDDIKKQKICGNEYDICQEDINITNKDVTMNDKEGQKEGQSVPSNDAHNLKNERREIEDVDDNKQEENYRDNPKKIDVASKIIIEEAKEMLEDRDKVNDIEESIVESKGERVNYKEVSEGEEEDNEGICDVCNEGDSDEIDTIIYCDGCNVAVHTTCYHLDGVPEGSEWYCKLCLYFKGLPLSHKVHEIKCLICQVDHIGAMMEVKDIPGAFIHLLCVLQFSDTLSIENGYVCGFNEMKRDKWMHECSICRRKSGLSVPCGHKSCLGVWFHSICAREEGYKVEYPASKKDGSVTMSILCTNKSKKKKKNMICAPRITWNSIKQKLASMMNTLPPSVSLQKPSSVSLHNTSSLSASTSLYNKKSYSKAPIVPIVTVYKCTFEGCTYSTEKKPDFTVHNKLHTGPRPYFCETCNSRFSDVLFFRNHIKICAKFELQCREEVVLRLKGLLSSGNNEIDIEVEEEVVAPPAPIVQEHNEVKVNVINGLTPSHMMKKESQLKAFWKDTVCKYYCEVLSISSDRRMITTHDKDLMALNNILMALNPMSILNMKRDMMDIQMTLIYTLMKHNEAKIEIEGNNHRKVDEEGEDYEWKFEPKEMKLLMSAMSKECLDMEHLATSCIPVNPNMNETWSLELNEVNAGVDYWTKELKYLLSYYEVMNKQNAIHLITLRNTLRDELYAAKLREDEDMILIRQYEIIASKAREKERQAKNQVEDDMEAQCCICCSGQVEYGNQIVFCDGCNVPVHQKCYQVGPIPEDDWFCIKCRGRESVDINKTSCCLCPAANVNGAYSYSSLYNEWMHTRCALFIGDMSIDELNSDKVAASVKNKEIKTKCNICRRVGGCTVKCSEVDCSNRFHVCCGTNSGLVMLLKDKAEGGTQYTYCTTHTKARIGDVKIINKNKVTSRRQSLASGERGQQAAASLKSAPGEESKLVCSSCGTVNKVPSTSNNSSSDGRITTCDNAVKIFCKTTERLVNANLPTAATSTESKVEYEVFALRCRSILTMLCTQSESKSQRQKLLLMNDKLKKETGYTSGYEFHEELKTVLTKTNRENMLALIESCMSNLNLKIYSSVISRGISILHPRKKVSPGDLWCLCKSPFVDGHFMICCDYCEYWYHPDCIGYMNCDVHGREICLVRNDTGTHLDISKHFCCPACNRNLYK